MPNIITHGLFAKSVLEKTQNNELKSIIQSFPREFVIGSNGPDFFFFYKFFQKKYENIRNIGNIAHSEKINDFYETAYQIIQNETDGINKKAMISYLCGHLCHWALDSHTHPYIFYKTGFYSELGASMHHRFESMLDAMMLKKFRNETIRTFKFYLLSKQSPYSIKAISSLYVPICHKVFNIEITEKHIKDALDDWYKIQTYLYDPKGVKTKILKVYEKKVNHPYLYSGNVIPTDIDLTYDVLNENHSLWLYPTNKEKTSNESFIEIYNRACDIACDLLNHFDNGEHMLQVLDNKTYDTGENTPKEMKYFDLIYGDIHENI